MTKDTFIEEDYFHSRYGKYISLAFESNILNHFVLVCLQIEFEQIRNASHFESHLQVILFTTLHVF